MPGSWLDVDEMDDVGEQAFYRDAIYRSSLRSLRSYTTTTTRVSEPAPPPKPRRLNLHTPPQNGRYMSPNNNMYPPNGNTPYGPSVVTQRNPHQRRVCPSPSPSDNQGVNFNCNESGYGSFDRRNNFYWSMRESRGSRRVVHPTPSPTPSTPTPSTTTPATQPTRPPRPALPPKKTAAMEPENKNQNMNKGKVTDLLLECLWYVIDRLILLYPAWMSDAKKVCNQANN